MKLVEITLLAFAAALAGTNALGVTKLMPRDLRVETSDTDAIEADLRDDELGANEDFWGSWENQYTVPQEDTASCSNETNSASGTGEHAPTVGDIPAMAKEVLRKAESVVTAALPFSVEHATSLVLPIGVVVAALLVIAVAAVLIGVRRQQLSEPMFGAVELASDLPDPMTACAAGGDDLDTGSPRHTSRDDEADTGATILVGEEQEEKGEEEGNLIVALT